MRCSSRSIGRRPARDHLGASGATRAIDVGTMAVANLGVSIPVFVLGLVLAFVFAIVLKGTPVRPAAVAAG